MPERSYRILGEPPVLNAQEQREVTREIVRLHALLARRPEPVRTQVGANPSGLLGEYVANLLEAAARGASWRALFPLTARLLYGRRRWFRFSQAVVAQVGAMALQRDRAQHQG